MRGVIVFLIALFLLAPYYLIMSMAYEPLAEVILTYDLSALGGDSTISIYKNIMYLWGPAVYIVGWFAWAVRYYISRNLFLGPRQVRRP